MARHQRRDLGAHGLRRWWATLTGHPVRVADFPLIRAWHHLIGSSPEHLIDQLGLARTMGAPADACYLDPVDGVWVCADQIRELALRQLLGLPPLPNPPPTPSPGTPPP